MKYFCLSIETATQRREHCSAQFAREGIEVQFVNAFDAIRNNVKHTDSGFTPGHLGCFISHMHLIEEIRRYDHGPSLVFEDDVLLAEGFAQGLAAAMDTLPDDWQVAFAGWWPAHWDYSRITSEQVAPHWLRISSGRIWGCYAYIVNGRYGADAIIGVMQPCVSHMDETLYGAVRSGRVRGYFLSPALARWDTSFPSQTWAGQVPDLNNFK